MLAWAAFLCARPPVLASNESFTFRFALTRARPHALAEAVAAVSEPDSASFRRYLSEGEVATLLTPSGLETVEAWIKHGAPTASLSRQAHGSGQVLEVTAPAAEVAALMGVSLVRYGRIVRAAPQAAPPPALPASVAPHITAVLGLFE
eukprot:746725-Prymnesium_polylepis.1